MNIGIVTDTFYPRVNGVVQSIMTFTRQFRKLGHRVVIFAPKFPGPQTQEEDVWRFPSHYLFFNPEDRLPNPLLPGSRRLFAQVPQLKLDIIHTQTPFTLGTAMAKRARRWGIPSVHTYHTLFEAYLPHYFPFLPKPLHQPMASWISRTFCELHDAVVVPSTAIAEVMQRYRLKVPIEIIPTGTDLTPFNSVNGPRMRQQLGFADEDELLLTMGRVAHEKNIPFLYDVLERLLPKHPRAKLVIAGQGPALESVKALCRERRLESRVLFVGLLSKQDWVDLYAAADLELLASVTETQGLVLTEAMAAGTPCVAVAAMGVKDVMAGGGGIAVPQDVAAFAGAVDRLLTDPNLYDQKLAEAKVQARNWSAETKAAEMLKFYQRLIDAKAKTKN